MLRSIGYIYEQEGKKFLGGFTGFAADFTSKAHVFKETVSAVRAAVQLQQSQRDLQAADEARRATLEEKMMSEGFVAIWRLGKLEVESTLRKVCEVVLNEKSTSKDISKRRAEGLKIIGKIFKNAK